MYELPNLLYTQSICYMYTGSPIYNTYCMHKMCVCCVQRLLYACRVYNMSNQIPENGEQRGIVQFCCLEIGGMRDSGYRAGLHIA